MIILEKKLAGASRSTLARFLTQARRAAGLRGKVNVLITGSGQIRQLNRRYRGKDEATDVLSFPAAAVANEEFAGDIAISAKEATRAARRFGHQPAEELKILMLHGVLHLAGYDHERGNGRMARVEERLRGRLGLPTGLIARQADPPAGGARPRRSPRGKGRSS